MSTPDVPPYEPPVIAVIGSGIAGLSAAVSAAEALADHPGAAVELIDRAEPHEAGGLTRWTSAYLRLDDVYEPGDSFVDDILAFSDGRTPTEYVRTLVDELPATMEWIQSHGVRFRRLPTYFINSSRRRLQPVGGGEALINTLLPAAQRLGVRMRYGTTATHLITDDTGRVAGVSVCDATGRHVLRADAVIVASGGFEGNPDFLAEELAAQNGTTDVTRLIPIAPGVRFNRGEGIRMALDAGAKRGGDWQTFHAEPVDPRSSQPEALVMVFPYGIMVNKDGRRFLDEGRGTVDETYEAVARAVWAQPDGLAYFITDQQLNEVTARERGILTGEKPIVADTLADLAEALQLPVDAIEDTVRGFNAAVQDGTFDWRRPDGKATKGIQPPKSNWAVELNRPPFVAYPVSCAIVFTFGGLQTDTRAQVVDDHEVPIAGLYAAGECTGVYHGKYPGGTSVLRGMVYGRIAGTCASLDALARR